MAVNVCIIAIGDELLSGQVADVNSAWLSRFFQGLGMDIGLHLTVADEPEGIISALEYADGNYHWVVLTGGLGPTEDDRTRDALCAYFKTTLSFDERWWETLKERYEKHGRKLSPSNRTQAHIPVGATLLPNPHGTAPVLLMESGETSFIALPGVPHEVRLLAEEQIKPLLPVNEAKASVTLRTIGLPESRLGEMVYEEVDRPPDVDIAFLPDPGSVDIRITAKIHGDEGRKKVEMIAAQLETFLGSVVYDSRGRSLAKVVLDLAHERGERIALAESCTGGLIGVMLTDVPGSSEVFEGGVVAYSNAMKANILDVPDQLIETHGAVSEEVALAMAQSARDKAGATWGLATTGVAGPGGGTAEKPVGMTCMSVAGVDKTVTRTVQLPGDRDYNRLASARIALNLLRLSLMGDV